MFVAVSCDRFMGGNDTPDGENQGNVNENENENQGTPDGGNGEDSGNVETPVTVNKDALSAELALEVAEQGDYTEASYNAYLEKLAAAKAAMADEAATQDSVDKAAADLTAARNNLKVRSISAVENTNKEIKLVPGDVREITLADYINDNGLSKVAYKVESNHDAVLVSEILDGKFTVTAGDVSEYVDAKVSIVAYYDGVQKLEIEFSVKITNDIAPVLKNDDVVKEFDVFALSNKESLVLDFAENVNNAGALELSYSVKCGEETITLDGTTYTLTLGEYGDDYTYVTYTVTVSYVANGNNGSLEYTYKLGLKDTTKYNVVNGSFDNGLEGWTINTTEGELPFGGIDNRDTFWDQGFPMFNVGSYFSGVAEGASEGSHGTLASSFFTAKGAYATFMLGASGNPDVYITIENESGEVLAIFRNTMFCDLPQGFTNEQWHEMIGNSVFALNFVTYKVDISAYAGQKIRFVLHDYASSYFGFANFDELITYYAEGDALPEGAVLAENLLADKSDLFAELALEVAEQGDYTLDSFNAYLEKLAAAKAVIDDIAVSQSHVDVVVANLTRARLALEVRPVEAKADAEKSFKLFYGKSLELAIADYVETNGLSSITYEVKTGDNALEVTDSKFTFVATEEGVATISIIVYYKNEAKLTVEISVEVTKDLAPTVKETEVSKSYDIYFLENKESIIVDFSENIYNPGNLELSYRYATPDGFVTTPTYEYHFNYEYNENERGYVFNVTVSYVANGVEGSIFYEYWLNVRDTTKYRLENGGFENGLEGWTVVGDIGNVSSDKNYWVNDPESAEGFSFGMDGDNMFSAYAPGAYEKAVGTLTSSVFKISKFGWITFKLGAAKDGNYVYVDIVDADTKEILARYYNGLWAERTNDQKSGCTLIPYVANLSEFAGREVFIRISDNADSGYGLFFVDSIVTYYDGRPQDFNEATPVDYEVSGTIYDVFNGGFEMGNVQGWWNNGEIGLVTDASGYWGDNIPYGKDGDFLFTGVESFGADTMREGNRGTLTSSAFVLGGTGYISFKLGGGGSEHCYVQIIDVATGDVLARYHQQAQQDAKLIQYVADLSAHLGKTVRIQVVDYASSGWGCVSFDNVVTYYASVDSLPEAITANNIFHGNYDVNNGSFENGLDGWHQNIWEGGAHGTLGWVESSEHDAGWYTKNDDRKDGNNIFTFCRPDGTNCENTKGELVSSTFTLKQGSYVSFRFGGAGSREVRVELVRADGTVIATFYNEAPGKINTEMYAYFYQYNGETADCFFRVVDDSVSNYGCFVVDDFRANLESAPEGFIAAIQ